MKPSWARQDSVSTSPLCTRGVPRCQYDCEEEWGKHASIADQALLCTATDRGFLFINAALSIGSQLKLRMIEIVCVNVTAFAARPHLRALPAGKGMDLYFERHDGQAVTCDDFLAAMADANDEDLSALGRWYAQAGTPKLSVQTVYDAAAQTYSLTFTQSTPPTTGQPNKQAVLIPVSMGLLGPDGKEMELKLKVSLITHCTA